MSTLDFISQRTFSAAVNLNLSKTNLNGYHLFFYFYLAFNLFFMGYYRHNKSRGKEPSFSHLVRIKIRIYTSSLYKNKMVKFMVENYYLLNPYKENENSFMWFALFSFLNI